jgi:hypothetical protein
MPGRSPACPVCHQAAPVGKVSAIYVHALQAQHPKALPSGGAAEPPPAPRPAFLDDLSRAEMIALGKRLAPPSTPKKMPTRPLHPDLVVVVFSAILPVFLIGIRSSQPVMLYPVAALLALGYGLYFWKRGPAIAKFERQAAEDPRSRGHRGARPAQRADRCPGCRPGGNGAVPA